MNKCLYHELDTSILIAYNSLPDGGWKELMYNPVLQILEIIVTNKNYRITYYRSLTYILHSDSGQITCEDYTSITTSLKE